jgi:hypothetical protein
VTEINGLRLAYRGFVAGLAGGYVWLAIAMLASLPSGGPMDPVLTLGSVGPDGSQATAQEAFVLGLGLAQVSGAGIGMAFAYFFARFFTVRVTLGIAAICVAVLAWSLLSNRLAVAVGADPWTFGTSAALVVATIGYGWVLGWSIPVRGEVVRYSGSPST